MTTEVYSSRGSLTGSDVPPLPTYAERENIDFDEYAEEEVETLAVEVIPAPAPMVIHEAVVKPASPLEEEMAKIEKALEQARVFGLDDLVVVAEARLLELRQTLSFRSAYGSTLSALKVIEARRDALLATNPVYAELLSALNLSIIDLGAKVQVTATDPGTASTLSKVSTAFMSKVRDLLGGGKMTEEVKALNLELTQEAAKADAWFRSLRLPDGYSLTSDLPSKQVKLARGAEEGEKKTRAARGTGNTTKRVWSAKMVKLALQCSLPDGTPVLPTNPDDACTLGEMTGSRLEESGEMYTKVAYIGDTEITLPKTMHMEIARDRALSSGMDFEKGVTKLGYALEPIDGDPEGEACRYWLNKVSHR